MKLLNFFKEYGFLIVLLYLCGVFTPDFSPKGHLLDLDLNHMSEVKSGSDSFKQVFWILLSSLYLVLSIKYKENFSYQLVLRLSLIHI